MNQSQKFPSLIRDFSLDNNVENRKLSGALGGFYVPLGTFKRSFVGTEPSVS